MSPPAAPVLVAGVDINVAGQPLDPSLMDRLLEARVQDNLMLPDAFMLRLRDPDFQSSTARSSTSAPRSS
jgi:hypothetical protein